MNVRDRGFAQLMAVCLWLYVLAPYVVLLDQGTTDNLLLGGVQPR